jgi:pentose-5-phosphate-3-epimerase
MGAFKLSPSILTADFARLGEQIGAAEQAVAELRMAAVPLVR